MRGPFRLLASSLLFALALVVPVHDVEAATASTDVSARVSSRMATVSGWFRDSPALEAQLRVILSNTDAPYVARATGTLAAAATANIDTRGGMTYIDGTASGSISLGKVLIVRISNPAAGQTLKIGVGASNGVTTLVDLASAAFVVGGGIAGGYGGWLMAYNPAGWATTASTGDIIVLTNSGTVSLDYELVLIGS